MRAQALPAPLEYQLTQVIFCMFAPRPTSSQTPLPQGNLSRLLKSPYRIHRKRPELGIFFQEQIVRIRLWLDAYLAANGARMSRLSCLGVGAKTVGEELPRASSPEFAFVRIEDVEGVFGREVGRRTLGRTLRERRMQEKAVSAGISTSSFSLSSPSS
ncbi:hypothetical protein C8F01DRAFT_1126015 [Mycena amicta]|nr:hypothetical protein C8F01DRAFT_1126015 [Mycena amicta]